MPLELLRRPRRLRRTEAVRNLVRETRLSVNDLVWPLFVHSEPSSLEVASMPGVSRLSPDDLLRACSDAVTLGIPAVAIFPSINPALKDPSGSHALNPDNILFQAIRSVKDFCPELLVITDVALDPYTSHGHDGLLADNCLTVDNDSTVEMLCELAVMQAEAGADIVAPSDMMDGRVRAVRESLDSARFADTMILSYAVKYASALYGPFRDAVGSQFGKKAISKASYQMDPANRLEAKLEAELDIEEGADMLMVKPASYYLDIIREVRDISPIPVAAYQVSGEYAQIQAAAQLGWLDRERTRDESLLAIKRAGADFILTYFAMEVAESMAREAV